MATANRDKVYFVVFAILVVIKLGASFTTRQAGKEAMDMVEKYGDREKEIGAFYDSLVENEDFRKLLLDTVTTNGDLQQTRANQRKEMIKRIEEFKARYPNREKVIRNLEFWDGVSTLMNVLLVCIAIPWIIHLFEQR